MFHFCRYIDAVSHQVLTFLLGSMYRLPTYPATIQVRRGPPRILTVLNAAMNCNNFTSSIILHVCQALLAVAIIECLSILLDRLATACAPSHALPGPSSHAPRLLILFHGAACCVRRRLLTFRVALESPNKDEFFEAMVRGYANTLLQAEDVVSRLAQQIVAAHGTAASSLIWAPVDRTDWSSFRRPLKRALSASSAPRIWRCALSRLVHSLGQLSSATFSGWVLSQVSYSRFCALLLKN